MNDLVERYIHQVGYYLPPKERSEIMAELRSQIYDQLEDRYATGATEEQVIGMLKDLGSPHQMARSYGTEQYLIGPELYPTMMFVLRRGWFVIPSIMLFLSLFRVLITPIPSAFLTVLIETLISTLVAIALFSGAVISVFAVIQHTGNTSDAPFNPLTLPKVDDPTTIDRFELSLGATMGIFVTLLWLYFLRVGGLTLHFDLSHRVEIIPVPIAWLIALIVAGIAQIIISALVLRHRHWTIALWIGQALFELCGIICVYFAILTPFVNHLLAQNASLNGIPFIHIAPEMLTIGYGVIVLINKGITLMALWHYDKFITKIKG